MTRVAIYVNNILVSGQSSNQIFFEVWTSLDKVWFAHIHMCSVCHNWYQLQKVFINKETKSNIYIVCHVIIVLYLVIEPKWILMNSKGCNNRQYVEWIYEPN